MSAVIIDGKEIAKALRAEWKTRAEQLQEKNIQNEYLRIKKSAKLANEYGIEVHAGHGLDYKSTKILSNIDEIKEFNIGHFIIGESIFFGINTVIKKFKKIIK